MGPNKKIQQPSLSFISFPRNKAPSGCDQVLRQKDGAAGCWRRGEAFKRERRRKAWCSEA